MSDDTKKEKQEEVVTEKTEKEEVSAEKTPTDKEVVAETKEEVEIPAQFKDLVEKIESMSILELHELVKLLEKKFGVSAQAATVASGPAAGGAAEEKDSFTVELASVGDQKIQVIKAVKEVLGLGLKEAKDLTDSAPSVLKEDVKKEDAEAMKKAIETAGGTVNLK